MIARVALAVLALGSAAPEDADGPLIPGDLAAYREALATPAPGDAPAVTFRDLWERPEEFREKLVRVRVRVARVFTQGASGDFPALMEVWGFDNARNPIALVAPIAAGEPPRPGAFYDFGGTFLKRLHYAGADAERSAPLIVGPEPPTPVAAPASPPGGPPDIQWGAWLALLLALGAATLLAARHAARPIPRGRDAGPPPEFVDRAADDADSS